MSLASNRTRLSPRYRCTPDLRLGAQLTKAPLSFLRRQASVCPYGLPLPETLFFLNDLAHSFDNVFAGEAPSILVDQDASTNSRSCPRALLLSRRREFVSANDRQDLATCDLGCGSEHQADTPPLVLERSAPRQAADQDSRMKSASGNQRWDQPKWCITASSSSPAHAPPRCPCPRIPGLWPSRGSAFGECSDRRWPCTWRGSPPGRHALPDPCRRIPSRSQGRATPSAFGSDR